LVRQRDPGALGVLPPGLELAQSPSRVGLAVHDRDRAGGGVRSLQEHEQLGSETARLAIHPALDASRPCLVPVLDDGLEPDRVAASNMVGENAFDNVRKIARRTRFGGVQTAGAGVLGALADKEDADHPSSPRKRPASP
jgi:hypothetical protein